MEYEKVSALFIICTCVALILVLLLLYLRWSKKNRRVDELQDMVKSQKEQLDSKDNQLNFQVDALNEKLFQIEQLEGVIEEQSLEPMHLRELLTTSVEFQSKEVLALFSEINRTIKTDLSLVSLKLAEAHEMFSFIRSDKKRQKFDTNVMHSQAIITRVITNLKALIQEYAAVAVQEQKLSKVLMSLCDEYAERFESEVTFHQLDHHVEPSIGQQRHIYCSVKEALSDAFERYGATQATVTIGHIENRLNISIVDNGTVLKGSPPTFANIITRAKLLHGKVKLSVPDSGARQLDITIG